MSQCILITGANRGIGLELTRQLVGRGHSVVACTRRPDSAVDLASLAAASPGCRVEALDVTDSDSVAGLATTLEKDGVVLDTVINNAGIMREDYEKSWYLADPGLMAETFNVNVLGCIRVAQAMAPLLRRSDRPVVVNLSSSLGSIERCNGRMWGYRMSKAAVNMMTKSLAHDEPDWISICMHPGWVKTDMGGADAEITVEESAAGICSVLDKLSSDQNGAYLDYQGEPWPW